MATRVAFESFINLIRYKTNTWLQMVALPFESFVNLIRYKTINWQFVNHTKFESFINLIRYKTCAGSGALTIRLRALLI
jgi:hypothetical protein